MGPRRCMRVPSCQVSPQFETQHCLSLVKKTCARQGVLDKWFPPTRHVRRNFAQHITSRMMRSPVKSHIPVSDARPRGALGLYCKLATISIHDVRLCLHDLCMVCPCCVLHYVYYDQVCSCCMCWVSLLSWYDDIAADCHHYHTYSHY